MKTKLIAGLSAILMALPLLMASVNADTSYVTATIGGYCSQTLSAGYQNNVTFGTLAQGTSDNNATGNGDGETVNGDYNITTSSNTNCNITWSSGNFVSGGNTLAKGNFSMNVTEDPDIAGLTSTTFANPIEVGNLNTGSIMHSNFFLDVPSLQAKGAYTATLTITVEEL
jgi:hypothetical protein